MSGAAAMTPEVAEAVVEVVKKFSRASARGAPDKDGGARGILEDVLLRAQGNSWIGFHITHQCPYADVYPHFIRADFYPDDAKLPAGMGRGSHVFPQPGVVANPALMPPRAAIQVSRRANKRDDS